MAGAALNVLAVLAVLTVLALAALTAYAAYRARVASFADQRRLVPLALRMTILKKLYDTVAEAASLSSTRPFLIYGTLLGYVRERSLICYDYDVDFGIDQAGIGAFTESLRTLVEPGYRLRVYNSRFNLKVALVHAETKLAVDVFAFETSAETGHVKRARVPAFVLKHFMGESEPSYPSGVVFPLQRATFLGRQCWLPANASRMLASVYGPEYMRPDRVCDHRCESCERC